MNYYQQQAIVARVGENDNLLGQVEKWEAHKQGLLHRGFTVILQYKSSYLLQRRKHPVFDDYLDLSFSSHPVYINGKLQLMLEAIYQALKREWGLVKKDLVDKPVFKGKFIYKAFDKKSGFTEHEVDHIYLVGINKLPKLNLDFAYEYFLMSKYELLGVEMQEDKVLAPWALEIIKRGLLD